MITPSVRAAPSGAADPREAALRKVADDMHGLFIQQLYKSMRESVPTEGGLVERSQGEEMFAGLMDERVAADTGTRWHRGLGDAIYRALREKAGLDSAPSPAPPSDSVVPAAASAAPVRTP